MASKPRLSQQGLTLGKPPKTESHHLIISEAPSESQEFSITNLQSYRSEASNDNLLSKPKTNSEKTKATVAKEQGMLDVHKALIDLYLDVKVRSNEEIVALNEDKLELEQQRLMETETLALVEYIKTSIEILLNLKMDSSALTKQSFRHQVRVDTEGTSQLDNSQVTSSSNFTSVNGGQQPPKAYEEMIQKLENDVRAHIRIEQQMKIAMEGLQQKLEDKDREKKQVKVEYKQYINELKQDKKRYVQLLELRDKEVERLELRVKSLQETEAQHTKKLATLDQEIEKYKSRKGTSSTKKEQLLLIERPSLSCQPSRQSILMASTTLNASGNQSFHQRGFLTALNNSNYADRKGSQSNSLVRTSDRKSPKRCLINQLQSQQALSRQQSKSPIYEMLQSQSKQDMKKKQTFLSETLKLKSREDHKSHSSNTSKVITSLKSSKVQQQPTTLTVNLCNSQSQTYLKPEKQQIPQKDADAQLNESFGEQRKSSEKKQSDAVTHIKSRASSSGNTTTSMSSTLNSNRVRSKENVLKLVSSKRQAVGNAVQKQNDLRPSSSISDLFHQQKQANQSSARLKVLTQSTNTIEMQKPLNISKLGATNSLYNKIILTQRK